MAYRNTFRADRPSNRQLRRNAHNAIELGRKAYMTLLAVLAQQGGEVTIETKTINQVGRDFAHLDYEVSPDGPNFFIIRLLNDKEVGTHGVVTEEHDLESDRRVRESEDDAS